MSMPTTPDHNQQLLGFLQTWQQLLEQWGAMTAGAVLPHAPSVMPTTSAGGQFMPPGIPFNPPGMPPMPPIAPPSPADYTQQLFAYLQAWRQYLEQMAGAKPASPQPPVAPPSTANSSGNGPVTSSAGATEPAIKPVVQRPPATDIGSKEPGPTAGGSVSAFAKSASSKPATPPPDIVVLGPANQGGSQIDSMSAHLDEGLLRTPNPPGPFGGPKPPAVFRPPIFDGGTQGVPRQFRREAVSPTGAEAPPPRRTPAAARAQRALGSPFLGVMGRVTSDAAPQFRPQTLFKNAGQTPSP